MRPLAKARGRTALAVWVSRIFHPFIVSTLTLFLAQRLSGLTIQTSIGWTGLTIVILILPVLAFVLIRVKKGRYQDVDVSVREDRYLLYGVTGVCFILLVVLLSVLGAPDIVQETLRAALFAFILAAVLNRFVGKVSLHMLVIGGSIAILMIVSPPLASSLGLLSLLVGWSRLYLKRHTFREVGMGWIVGIFGFGLWLLLA